MEQRNDQQTKKPKWLRKLEQESWQAELIISGLAIFTSLQLPGLIDDFAVWTIKNFVNPGWIMYFICWFLYLVSSIIIYSFVFHFILRTIWIGFIGLNSVFPQGIKREEGKMYSLYFLDRVIKDYPVGSLPIQSLDDLCSSIFAACTASSMVYLILTFDMLILLIVQQILSSFIPQNIIEIIGWSLFGLYSLIALAFRLLNLKRNHQDEKLQSYYYKFFQFSSKVFFHIFQRPLNYLTLILMTNFSASQHKGKLTASLLILISFLVYLALDSPIMDLPSVERYYQRYERTDQTFANYYEEELIANNQPLLTPFIESQIVRGKTLKLFIPVFKHESNTMEEVCGKWEKDKELDRDENRKRKRVYTLQCYQKYHKVYLNDRLVNCEFIRYTHRYQNTAGILAFLSTTTLNAGKNVLKVEKISTDPDKAFRTMNIPFWLEQE